MSTKPGAGQSGQGSQVRFVDCNGCQIVSSKIVGYQVAINPLNTIIVFCEDGVARLTHISEDELVAAIKGPSPLAPGKGCHNCRYADTDPLANPCRPCDGGENWEPES